MVMPPECGLVWFSSWRRWAMILRHRTGGFCERRPGNYFFAMAASANWDPAFKPIKFEMMPNKPTNNAF